MQLPASLSHGVFFSYVGLGVMICGDSGIGKSDCTLELIHLGAKLICDDAPNFDAQNGTLVGSCPSEYQGFMHIRGLGLLHIPTLLGPQSIQTHSPLDLIIQLSTETPKSAPVHEAMVKYDILEVEQISIPVLALKKAQDRPMGVIISTAIKQFKCRRENNDPCQKLIQREA